MSGAAAPVRSLVRDDTRHGTMTRPLFHPHLLRRAPMSLRTRLLLLVVASVVPLVGLGLVREYRAVPVRT